MNAVQLMKAVGCSLMTANTWLPHLEAAMFRFGIESVDERAAFIAQCAHESGRFSTLEENLNYSAQRLREVWPSRFPTLQVANMYAHDPNKLAEHVYSGRMGNGPEGSGDGFAFRGRGLLQATGRQMYYRLGVALGLPLMSYPDMLADPGPAALSAGVIWTEADCSNVLAKLGIDGVSRAINLGDANSKGIPVGMKERRELYAQARNAFAGAH